MSRWTGIGRTWSEPAGTIFLKMATKRHKRRKKVRYAIDSTEIRSELGWQPREDKQTGLHKTVE
jgi:dTDP-D-glucose 4,6-dehydratase